MVRSSIHDILGSIAQTLFTDERMYTGSGITLAVLRNGYTAEVIATVRPAAEANIVLTSEQKDNQILPRLNMPYCGLDALLELRANCTHGVARVKDLIGLMGTLIKI